MSERVDTVVIGGGQAGLATSYHLGRSGAEHLVLEQADAAGSAWRDGRWDSFTLVSPNWSFRLSGAEYQGDQPDGFMPRDEVVARLVRYVEDFDLPVRFGVTATSVMRDAESGRYLVRADDASFDAANVVVATGLFQRPKLPAMSADFPATIEQIHSGQYRNPAALADGAVLVVGTAQSGCQIAQELYQHGRTVYLCVGSAGRIPRRYRGRDIFEWLNLSGYLDRTVADLPSPRARFAGNPHLSGRDGGQTLNLHQFARDGVVLLGHLRGVSGSTAHLASDLRESLAEVDEAELRVTGFVDAYVAKAGLDAPCEDLPVLRDGYLAEQITELDLASAGITTIVWATGYGFDFGLVRPPVFDSDGFPIQNRGVTGSPGLFFVGMPWLYRQKSGLLVGVGEDAEYVASKITARCGGGTGE
jgi:putative flavoprotein involved in K+ transport